MPSPSLDELASRFHDHLKAVKEKTPLECGDWYPWRTLSSIQMLGRELGMDVEALKAMIGPDAVLDVGCGDGDIAFFLESLGASVDAVDHAPTNYNRMEGVRTLQRALESNIGIHAADLDSRPNLPGSSYGLAIMLGVLYHLKNPYLALETLAQNSRYLYMSTRIAARTPDRKLNFGELPMAYLVDDRELNDDPTNFWIFSEVALKRVVRRAGWNILKYFTAGASPAGADPVTAEGDARAYILAESRLSRDSGLRLGRGWHELEYGASRWTERRFSVNIQLPAALSPATLRFLFQLPDALVERRPRTTVSARMTGAQLPSAIFTTPGEHEYSATVDSLSAGLVDIDFELDAAVRFANDERELGVQVFFNGGAPIRIE